jgi:hypothetical protein
MSLGHYLGKIAVRAKEAKRGVKAKEHSRFYYRKRFDDNYQRHIVYKVAGSERTEIHIQVLKAKKDDPDMVTVGKWIKNPHWSGYKGGCAFHEEVLPDVIMGLLKAAEFLGHDKQEVLNDLQGLLNHEREIVPETPKDQFPEVAKRRS